MHQQEHRQVFAHFVGQSILQENGRLLFHLLHTFLQAGYRVNVFSTICELITEKWGEVDADLPPPARLVLTLTGLTFTDSAPSAKHEWILLYDELPKKWRHAPWCKKIRIRYDLFSAYRFEKPILPPYFIHPVQAASTTMGDLQRYRGEKRKIGVFFAGDTIGYRRTFVTYPEPKLPRAEVIDAIVDGIGEPLELITHQEDLRRLESDRFRKKCVIIDTRVRIDAEQWLATISKAEFFICPPGIVMPMCHNIIEAMAVGTIPITNYPEWFDPPLRDGSNCLVFRDRRDLLERIEMTFSMSRTNVSEMQRSVISYYNSHLRPDILVNRIEERNDSRLSVLMYTERNAKENRGKLRESSVLLKGCSGSGEWAWLGALFRAERFSIR